MLCHFSVLSTKLYLNLLQLFASSKPIGRGRYYCPLELV